MEYRSPVVLVVRAKKDRDAVEATLENFLRTYSEWWRIEVRTLQGARRVEQALEVLKQYLDEDPHRYYVVLVGREEKELLQLEAYLPDNVLVAQVPKARVRNTRPHQIFTCIQNTLARVRLELKWCSDHYTWGRSRLGTPLRIPLHPMHDVYLALGEEHRKRWGEVLGTQLPTTPLIVKLTGDLHSIYVGPREVAKVRFSEVLTPQLEERCGEVPEVKLDLERQVQVFREVLRLHEEISVKLLRDVAEKYEYDRVVVPWSGGKDSTAVLLLTLKVFRREEVVPIFVDTELELEPVYQYVEEVSRILGVRPEVEKAGIVEEWTRRRYELPTHEERWCTKLKIAALERAVRRVADHPLIVVGDRDTESLLRIQRPPVRPWSEYLQVAPIKYWSALMVQLYLLSNGVPLNPLYYLGFYRIGCYICPAYRTWELDIAEELLRRESATG